MALLGSLLNDVPSDATRVELAGAGGVAVGILLATGGVAGRTATGCGISGGVTGRESGCSVAGEGFACTGVVKAIVF